MGFTFNAPNRTLTAAAAAAPAAAAAAAAGMAPIRGGGGTKSGDDLHKNQAAAKSVGGDADRGNLASAPAGHSRPSRISSAIALASFNWTDDVIVEVGEPR